MKTLPNDSRELEELIREQRQLKGNLTHPLWREIRSEGLKREFPLLEKMIEFLAKGKVRIEKQRVLNEFGQELENGFDLTETVEALFTHSKERANSLPERR